MRNIKPLGLAALIAATGLLATACPNNNGEGGHTHEWEWVTVTWPSATANGEQAGTCRICGETATRQVRWEVSTFAGTGDAGLLTFCGESGMLASMNVGCL